MVLQRYVQFNLIHPSGSYGWPITTFGVDYSGRLIAINKSSRGQYCR
jgi:glucose/arabinose dehydrogenase